MVAGLGTACEVRVGEGSAVVSQMWCGEGGSSSVCRCAGERQPRQVSWRANLETAFHRLQLGQRRWGAHRRTAQRTSTTARERGPPCAPSTVAVQWSISLLTLVEALMAAGRGADQLPSLPAPPQATHV